MVGPHIGAVCGSVIYLLFIEIHETDIDVTTVTGMSEKYGKKLESPHKHN